MCHVTYRISAHISRNLRGSLVDRGANGGIAGDDVIILHRYEKYVDVTGIDNHEMTGLQIVDCLGKVMTQLGEAIVILRQYAYLGKGKTIHSSGQIEYHHNKVDDRSMVVGGSQCIRTHDGKVIPLDIINGLPYMKMVPPTERECKELPSCTLTSDEEWSPKVLDKVISFDSSWYNDVRKESDDDYRIQSPFDDEGRLKGVEPSVQIETVDDVEPTAKDTNFPRVDEDSDSSDEEDDLCTSKKFRKKGTATTDDDGSTGEDTASTAEETFDGDEDEDTWDGIQKRFIAVSDLSGYIESLESLSGDEEATRKAFPIRVQRKDPDFERYRLHFLNVPLEKVKETFRKTTQFASNVMAGEKIRQTLKAPYPATNIPRRNEGLASDSVKAAVAAIGSNGCRYCQLFVGTKSLVADVYLMKSTSQFVATLQDVIRERGAPNILITDSANDERSKVVLEILRSLVIKAWASEAKYQHQNPAERRWQQIKHNTQWIMAERDVDPDCWFLAMRWVCDVMNHTCEKSLKGRPPLQVLNGVTIDISILLIFLFWDRVYVSRDGDSNYSDEVGDEKTNRIYGRFVGFSWNVGHALTFRILTEDTRQIIDRSRVRLVVNDPCNDPKNFGRKKSDIEYIRSQTEELGFDHLPVVDLRDKPIQLDRVRPSLSGLEDEVIEEEHSEEEEEKRSQTKVDGRTLKDVISEESPMDDPSLRDQPEAEPIDLKDKEQQPRHIVDKENRRKIGEPNPNNEPLEFTPEEMETDNPTVGPPPPTPEECIGRSVLLPPEEDGVRQRAYIDSMIEEHLDGMKKIPERIKFKCKLDDGADEVLAYDTIASFIEEDQTWKGLYNFKDILNHKNGMKPGDKDYKGCGVNLLIKWEDGSQSWEPLSNYLKPQNIPYTAAYARKHKLVGQPGWKSRALRRLCEKVKMFDRQIKKAKLHSLRTKPRYKFGVLVPRNYEQALELDEQNGDTKWKDAIDLELQQVISHGTFRDLGFAPGPNGFQKIRVHYVFDCKHDGRRKARLVAGGHLTETPVDPVYSSVVSLRGIRLLTFLAELNKSEFWATDIGNAYLESYTREKVYIVAGPEFGELAGHTIIIAKALYGLRSSGRTWHERLADVLRDMGFVPSKAESDIWMREKDGLWEYIGVYVDDLAIVSKDPQAIIDDLSITHKFALKGTGPVTYHLGCDFFRTDEGVMCFQPKKYIEKMIDNYQRIFKGELPRKVYSPLEKGDHPETDTSELLDEENTKIYQSLIGALQWVIQIGRFDVCTAVMTMSRFRAAPRQGHLDRVKRIHGYLSRFRGAAIRIRTDMPDYSDLQEYIYDWQDTCYKGAKEPIPDNAPKPLGKPVRTTSFVDANLYHDLVNGRSVTGILHMVNQTPIDWFSKLQATVETATYGSEFVATRQCVEQIIDLRLTLRYLGVPIEGSSYLFGDNKSVVDSSTMPHGKLHKRHHALSFHKTREAVAAGIVRYHHVRSE